MKPWVCMLCGYRAETAGACAGCRKGPLLDIREEGVRDLIRDHDSRRRQGREQGFLWIGVAVGIVVVLAANVRIPTYQQLRRDTMALPFFLDQILLMAAIGYVVQRGLAKLFPVRARFPEAAESRTCGMLGTCPRRSRPPTSRR